MEKRKGEFMTDRMVRGRGDAKPSEKKPSELLRGGDQFPKRKPERNEKAGDRRNTKRGT